ncbi:hypothetical protein VA596_15950 [Amycolatopsis sp., V23-08]|uniref:Uncharacterized protein n=1 Tax=Amycolatopsis heterodermiae TaxID=3110235 RepID=A0ABU5R4F3_9PSEU|nr:hypothetical protein [Amycolatopsis sp., V23-08]MEA5361038.1 hypothetical protein [Amycolatopsis sp., V23-08]
MRASVASINAVLSGGEAVAGLRIDVTHHGLWLITGAGSRIVIELDGAPRPVDHGDGRAAAAADAPDPPARRRRTFTPADPL